MPLEVKKDVCIGCGSCVAICPASFQMSDEGKSEPIAQDILDCTQEASNACPVQAIVIS